MFAINKILLPIDFSPRSADAAHAAAVIAERFHSEITLLHVLAPRFEAPLAIPGQRNIVHGFAREEVEERMKQFRCDEWRSLKVQRVLREGDPAGTIVEYAESEHTNLIMMPTHGYGPFRRLLLGSVTAKVLHDAECPVWTAAHSEQQPPQIPPRPRRIACAVDLGTQSGDVLRWASRLSHEFGAPLSVVHATAFDPEIEGYYLGHGWRDEVIREAMAKVTKFLEGEGVNGEIHIELGSVPEAVIECVREQQADVLVIGRSAHSGVTGRLPTNAYAIIRSAPCPVLGV